MKMTCPDEERLLDYLEGRLSEEDRSRVEEHLSDCERCLEALVVTNGLLRSRDRFELEAVPPEVTEAAVNDEAMAISPPGALIGIQASSTAPAQSSSRNA